MSKTVKQLQELMIDQLKRRGYYPKEDKEVLLRLGEEMGEVFEAVRENQTKEELSYEVVDVFWNILRFCELKKIDLEKAFIEKLEKNEKRSLAKQVNDISENS
ncbi:MAG: MazG nucleotide pyrophosphohydrolase [Candidatus Woesebacteria bacterium GW2011_GWA1_37_7]|uniref:MazG nucleotide pyrophosphohydrolase n=1 Tax=Candidatus Woesebacteria bacterium GW2011_GWA1_37_7 TaxID=1618545 RepID=A0A0G0JG52_9BACT|nr:MAG: MazG nucleotide pyrophosphohydrolase [Candidatus Woesebacteria bacterium GW2011_GWA1_37_7]